MKKLLYKLVIFILITVPLCYAFQWIIDTGLKKSNFSPEYKEWNDIVKSKINAAILIQGSSRAWVHISPKALEDSFKIPAYNLGMDGQNFPIQKARYDIYRKYNKKPAYIIQAVDVNFFNNPVVSYDFNQFIPYLNEDFGTILKEHSFFTYKDFTFPLYKYSHSPGIATEGFISFFRSGVKDNGKYKGFRSYNSNWNPIMLDTFARNHPNGFNVAVDTGTITKFEQFIQDCKKEQIKLILVYTPVERNFQNLLTNRDSIINIFTRFAEKYPVTYLDYSKNSICTDTSLFYNPNHLNAKGVDSFNKLLLNDLKQIIK